MSKPARETGYDARSIRERTERAVFRAYKQVRQRMGMALPRTHVFVAGMQRSGTNMLIETLEWSPYTDVYHETDPRAFDNYEMRPLSVIQELARRSSAPFFVIKSLCELDLLRQLLEECAPAKVVWIVRHYHDSTNSAIRSFGNFVPQLKRLSKNKDSDGWRGRGMSDASQDLIRRLAHPDMGEASAAALTWYYRNVLFFEQGLDRDPRVALIAYEDLVHDPTPRLAALCDFLGVPGFSPWMTRFIHAASVRKAAPPPL
nr:sulfotransferase [Thiobacillaceae bacterium]